MKKISILILAIFCGFGFVFPKPNVAMAASAGGTYYTVYENSTDGKVLFLKGDDVSKGDFYLSHDNKLYEIVSTDDSKKTAIAKFVRDEEMPSYNVKRKNSSSKRASAAVTKKVGLYHTHNDESYYTPDGVDSVYGKGGIHDVGKSLSDNLNKLGIETIYREDLHLPHNSGAYTRSQVTAAAILNQGVAGIFDIHRDSTKRSEYLTTVDGVKMSSIRMVVGSSSANYEENKKFAYSIKSYADSVYPGLVKDIYFGRGNYNQQLSTRAMLFEFGCENIEKDLVLKSTKYLAKVIDVVLFGSENASKNSLADVESTSTDGGAAITGLATSDGGTSGSVNSNQTLWIVLGVIGTIALVFGIVMACSRNARYKVGRFFSEMFAGIFGKRKKVE